MVKHPLIYAGPGIYSPVIKGSTVEWQRNDNPLWGVQVDNIKQVQKFAKVVRIQAFEEKEQERWEAH